MKRIVIGALPVVALALMCTTAAYAQAAPGVASKPFAVRVGAGWLTDGDSRDTADDVGLQLGVGYRLPSRSLLSPARGAAAVDLDYFRATGDGGRVETLGFYYTERIPVAARDGLTATGQPVPYIGLGVGVVHTYV